MFFVSLLLVLDVFCFVFCATSHMILWGEMGKSEKKKIKEKQKRHYCRRHKKGAAVRKQKFRYASSA
jgi:hypothetical protein